MQAMTKKASSRSKNKHARSRTSVEIPANIYERYKALIETRKVVDVTAALVELFCDDPNLRRQVAEKIASKLLQKDDIENE